MEEAWEWLEAHPLNKGLEDPTASWEYMGSYRQGKKLVSDFRHKNHPLTNSTHTVSFGHIAIDEDIEKKYKI